MAQEYAQRIIVDIIMGFVDAINKEKQVNKVILYGSYSRGDYSMDSDIDVAVISPDFTGDRTEDQYWLMQKRRSIDLRLEPMPFKPEDFVPDDPFVREIIETGIEIFNRPSKYMM